MTRTLPLTKRPLPDRGSGTHDHSSRSSRDLSAQPPAVDLLRAAAREPSRPLDAAVRQSLEDRLHYDFGHIRVHSGAASDETAVRLGARAYALGRDIHLGAEARALTGGQRDRLLMHEAIHTVQQGGANVMPHDRLTISQPRDAAEIEAARISDALSSSRPVAHGLTRMVAPQVQRDLTGPRKSIDGNFDLNLKTESHPGAKSGMSGTIKFKASDKAPDSTSIRLLQIVRNEDLTTGKDYAWKDDRTKATTAADTTTGVQPGYFADVKYSAITPRTAKTDAPVSPYYRDYWPNPGSSQDGSKQGKTIAEASL